MKISLCNTKNIDIFSLLLMANMLKLKFFPHMYWSYSSTVLNTLHSTEAIPHCTALMLFLHCSKQPPQYWSYPPTALKLSPTVVSNLHSTEDIPQKYRSYPPIVLMLSSRCTEQPPQYWTDVIRGDKELNCWLKVLHFGTCENVKNCMSKKSSSKSYDPKRP